MRGKGEGAVFRVPADKTQKLQYWTGTIELPSPDGKRRRVTIRRKNKADLLTELDAKRRELKTRGDLPTKNQTVEQWFTYWYEAIVSKKVRPNTLAGYKSVVFQHIIPAIGTVKLDKLTAAHIRRVHDRITNDQGLSSTYALLAHRTMAVSLKVAVQEGRIGRNPADLTDAPRKSSAPREAFNIIEALAVLEYVSRDPDMGARWATALLTGARQGEVLGIEINRVTDVIDLAWQTQRLPLTDHTGVPAVPVDFEHRHLTGGLYLTRPKTKPRIIPLVDPLKTILERHMVARPPNPWGLLFTLNGKPIDPAKDWENWRAILKALKIEKNVTVHDLRHTAVDLLYASGVPEDLISLIVGHSNVTMTRAYRTKGDLVRLRAAMEQFSEQFSSLSGGRSTTLAAVES
ncbi:site-specific integrase [Glaciihabitans sp. UYNi722]|uniref:tyrosine-type recombinase/integrase n=1 Tax=Glaciihabitans sp. UYNi722 TaxID=3156344 RepID=UPI0033930A55